MFGANEPQKDTIWKGLQQQLMSNDFIEQYPEYPQTGFKNKGSEMFFLNFLWQSDCYISSSYVFP